EKEKDKPGKALGSDGPASRAGAPAQEGAGLKGGAPPEGRGSAGVVRVGDGVEPAVFVHGIEAQTEANARSVVEAVQTGQLPDRQGVPMKHSVALLIFALFFIAVAVTACSSAGSVTDTGEHLADTFESFEEFEAQVYRDPETGVYIVDGDTPILDREQLVWFY